MAISAEICARWAPIASSRESSSSSCSLASRESMATNRSPTAMWSPSITGSLVTQPLTRLLTAIWSVVIRASVSVIVDQC